MKKSIYFLVILFLTQSCSVYNVPISAELAVAADKKVKVITTDKYRYQFRRLESKNGRLFGITKRGSPTAKKLGALPSVIDGKYVTIDLSSLEIEKLRHRNKTDSRILTIVTILTTGILTAVTIFAISFANADWGFGNPH